MISRIGFSFWIMEYHLMLNGLRFELSIRLRLKTIKVMSVLGLGF